MSQSLPRSIQKIVDYAQPNWQKYAHSASYASGIRHFLNWYITVYEAAFEVETKMALNIGSVVLTILTNMTESIFSESLLDDSNT